MKIKAMTISEYKDLMFYDKNVDVSLRTKKIRVTRSIAEMIILLNEIESCNNHNKLSMSFKWYHGERYFNHDIVSLKRELQDLKDLRNSL